MLQNNLNGKRIRDQWRVYKDLQGLTGVFVYPVIESSALDKRRGRMYHTAYTMRVDKSVFEFEWDKGNIGKNRKHRVGDQESEEPFLDTNKVIYKDLLHSKDEERYILLGKTRRGRLLYVVFAERNDRIRIISARDLNRREAHYYDEKA